MLKDPNWLIVRTPNWLLIVLWAALTFTAGVCVYQDSVVTAQRQLIQKMDKECK